MSPNSRLCGTWLAAVAGIVWAAHGSACSVEGTGGPTNADGAVLGTPIADAAVVVSWGAPRDAGVVDASRFARDAQQGRETQDAASGRDARTPDASGVTQDASTAPAQPAEGGLSTAAKPSPGCQGVSRPNGGRVSVPGDHTFTFPSGYDGSKPVPLLIGFHAAGNPIEQIEDLTQGSDMEKRYLRAFPKSKGSAWDYATDIGRVLAMYDALLASECVDMNRIFATGHSSGAQLIVQLLTPAHKADADHLGLRAVAPVAASRYGGVSRSIPVMYIQGARDNVRNSDGSDVVKEFTLANGCSAATQPHPAVSACNSGGKSVTNGCVQYAGCTAPTVWCRHDDPQYGNTNHGWPCFATRAMSEFFASLP